MGKNRNKDRTASIVAAPVLNGIGYDYEKRELDPDQTTRVFEIREFRGVLHRSQLPEPYLGMFPRFYRLGDGDETAIRIIYGPGEYRDLHIGDRLEPEELGEVLAAMKKAGDLLTHVNRETAWAGRGDQEYFI
ncbi:MAG TPA: hypothetical protein PKJ51_07630 [Methanothrix sp.]|nr:hypothetical protein [Methanothrix sp.]